MIGDNHPKGFTLFETVVVLAVFSLVMVMVVTIFENASQSQRKQALSQAAISDARLTLTSLTQAIKNQHIDYDFYKGKDFFEGSPAGCNTFPLPEVGENDPCNLEDPVPVLALSDPTGRKTRYYYDSETQKLMVCVNEPLTNPRDCKYNADPSLSNYVDVTPDSLHFTVFTFYITPVSSPAFRGTPTVCGNDNGCICVRTDSPSSGQWSADLEYNGVPGCPDDTSGYCLDPATIGNCALPDTQPTVTMVVELEGEGLQAGSVRVPFQITATSRIYDR